MTLLSLLDSHFVDSLDAPHIHALALMGSHVRGDAGPYSDIDVVRFVDEDGRNTAGGGSHIAAGRLVVVSDVTPAQVEEWFREPEAAVATIRGVRGARVIRDRNGYVAAIQARAHAFVWNEAMQERADRWASARMVGWIEEAHKGLEGVRRDDIGRLLNARFGLSWGLSRVMTVQRGILLAGDNAFYDALTREMGPRSDWVQLWRTAFGIEGDDGRAPTLREQVIAGLRLYVDIVGEITSVAAPTRGTARPRRMDTPCPQLRRQFANNIYVLTAEMLTPVLHVRDAPLVSHTVELIRTALPEK